MKFVYFVYVKHILCCLNLLIWYIYIYLASITMFFSKTLCKKPAESPDFNQNLAMFFWIQGLCSPATSFLGPQPLALASSPCSVPMVRCSMLGTAWLEWRVSWKETPERVRWFNGRTLGWDPSLCGISCLLHLNSQSLAFIYFILFCMFLRQMISLNQNQSPISDILQ